METRRSGGRLSPLQAIPVLQAPLSSVGQGPRLQGERGLQEQRQRRWVDRLLRVYGLQDREARPSSGLQEWQPSRKEAARGEELRKVYAHLQARAQRARPVDCQCAPNAGPLQCLRAARVSHARGRAF